MHMDSQSCICVDYLIFNTKVLCSGGEGIYQACVLFRIKRNKGTNEFTVIKQYGISERFRNFAENLGHVNSENFHPGITTFDASPTAPHPRNIRRHVS